VVFRLEDIRGYKRACLPLIIPLVFALIPTKYRYNVLRLLDSRVGVLVATSGGSVLSVCLCPSWMPSEAMDEDDAARSQNTIRLRCGG
jgi:hypothetical protein